MSGHPLRQYLGPSSCCSQLGSVTFPREGHASFDQEDLTPGTYRLSWASSSRLIMARAHEIKVWKLQLFAACFAIKEWSLLACHADAGPLYPQSSIKKIFASNPPMKIVKIVECYGPKLVHTHFYYLGINFPFTQDICYTGLSARNYFV